MKSAKPGCGQPNLSGVFMRLQSFGWGSWSGCWCSQLSSISLSSFGGCWEQRFWILHPQWYRWSCKAPIWPRVDLSWRFGRFWRGL